MVGDPQFFFRISYQDSESDLLKRKNYQEKYFRTGNNRTVFVLSRQTAHSQYGQLALGKFFCKTKNLNRVAWFDVISNFLLSKSDISALLAHWPRRGALCGQSKRGDSMSRFSGKICCSCAERVHEMPHSILLLHLYFDAISSGGAAGGTGVSGHRGPGAKGRTLSRDIFRHQSFAFLHGCLIIFKSGLLHATSLGVVRRHSPRREDFIGTDKKYQTSYSHCKLLSTSRS